MEIAHVAVGPVNEEERDLSLDALMDDIQDPRSGFVGPDPKGRVELARSPAPIGVWRARGHPGSPKSPREKDC
eukprot:3046655-Pyramimonas_sp.AAC.1